jgi:hypothetical protein
MLQVFQQTAGIAEVLCVKDGLQYFPNNSRIFTSDNSDRNVKFGIKLPFFGINLRFWRKICAMKRQRNLAKK